ncbi:MAG: DEAD/DEAH box helicase [Candidatus Aenigmarchaeota archaeon]|nr:DEAD/DEAH box helicase [Candidatus Aenigmarchaeota archaeon]
MQDNVEGKKILGRIGRYIEPFIAKFGISGLTAIQEISEEQISEGKDCLLIAPTGTGKTLAAMMPIFDRWLAEKHKPISILYITPLKSLNRDILSRLKWWAAELDMDIAVRHGDTTQYERTKQAEIPSDILITTPETLQSMLIGSVMRKNLSNVKFVVIDEVHELINSKRGAQLSIGLERLRNLCGGFQTVGLSATIGNPNEVAKFLNGSRECEIIKSADAKKANFIVETVKTESVDVKTASDLLIGVDTAARLRRIQEILDNRKSVIIFTNTREFAEILSSRLKKFSGHRIETHHGSLAKDVRVEFEKRFKEEDIKALVATSSLELGIDIGAVETVIQYQSPRQVSKLIQRVGRSGHSIGRTSEGIILSTGVDDAIESAAISSLALKGKIENPKPHKLAMDVLAHQIVGMALEKYSIPMKEIYEIIKKSYLYDNLEYPVFQAVCKLMQQLGHIYISGDTVNRKKSGWQYYFENLSTIASVRQYRIFDIVSRKGVGTLDEEFIALHGSPGTTFVVKGQSWRIIDTNEDIVNVEPADDIEASIPAWEGELIPVPFEVAQTALQIKSKVSSTVDEGEESKKYLTENYPIDQETAKLITSSIKKQSKNFGYKENSVVIEVSGDMAIIHTHFGALVNDTIGRALTFYLSDIIGPVSLKTDPYRIILRCQRDANKHIKDFFDKTSDKGLRSYIRENIHRSDLFMWRFFHNAKRFGAIARTADLGNVPLKKIAETYEGSPIYEETMREIFLEKLDLTKASEIISGIKKGDIKVSNAEGLSFFGRLALDRAFGELIGPERPDGEILKIFKERIEETKIRLICVNCGKWAWPGTVKDAPQKPKCSKCGAMMVTVVRGYDHATEQVIERKCAKRSLTADQQKTYDEALKIADLVMVSGKDAITALAGRGVGYATAARILAKYHSDENDLYKDILAAERQYFKTKRFWK